MLGFKLGYPTSEGILIFHYVRLSLLSLAYLLIAELQISQPALHVTNIIRSYLCVF